MNTGKPTNPTTPGFYSPGNDTLYKEMMNRRWVDSRDMCNLFRISRGALYRRCKANLLPYSNVGRKRIYDMWEIDLLLEERKKKF